MEPVKKNESAVVKTYTEDMADVLLNDKEGLVRKIISGAEKQEEEKMSRSLESKKNRAYLGVSLALIGFGVAAMTYFFFREDVKTVPLEEQFIPIIFTDRNSFVEVAGLKKYEIEQTILNQANTTTVKKGALEGIFPIVNKKIIGMREFFSMIKSSFTPSENEILVSDNFMMGIVNEGEEMESKNRPGFFIMLRTRSIVDIFESVRAWEAKMFFDLSGFFGYDINSDTAYLLTKDFEDGIVGNKNARFLYDRGGNIVLLYVFADDNSVVITNHKEAVREITSRLAAKEKKE